MDQELFQVNQPLIEHLDTYTSFNAKAQVLTDLIPRACSPVLARNEGPCFIAYTLEVENK